MGRPSRRPAHRRRRPRVPRPSGTDGARPDRVVEGRQQQPDHGRVGPNQRSAEGRRRPQLVPEREGADNEQKRRQEDGDWRQRRAQHAVRLRLKRDAQESREGEERAGHRLCRSVAGQELPLADPTWSHHRLVEQWEDDMPAAEHERARVVGARGHRHSFDPSKRLDQRQTDQERHKDHQGGNDDAFAHRATEFHLPHCWAMWRRVASRSARRWRQRPVAARPSARSGWLPSRRVRSSCALDLAPGCATSTAPQKRRSPRPPA